MHLQAGAAQGRGIGVGQRVQEEGECTRGWGQASLHGFPCNFTKINKNDYLEDLCMRYFLFLICRAANLAFLLFQRLRSAVGECCINC